MAALLLLMKRTRTSLLMTPPERVHAWTIADETSFTEAYNTDGVGYEQVSVWEEAITMTFRLSRLSTERVGKEVRGR